MVKAAIACDVEGQRLLILVHSCLPRVLSFLRHTRPKISQECYLLKQMTSLPELTGIYRTLRHLMGLKLVKFEYSGKFWCELTWMKWSGLLQEPCWPPVGGHQLLMEFLFLFSSFNQPRPRLWGLRWCTRLLSWSSYFSILQHTLGQSCCISAFGYCSATLGRAHSAIVKWGLNVNISRCDIFSYLLIQSINPKLFSEGRTQFFEYRELKPQSDPSCL